MLTGSHPLDSIAPYWLSAIVESADDAIISKTLEGTITSWNAGAARIFGYSAEEAIGQPVLMLIPPELHGQEPEILSRISRGERVEHFQTERMTKAGDRIMVSLTVSPIRHADGTIIGASKIARDITAWTRAQAQLAAALRQAEDASRLKDEFLATVSHELRTPLTAMMGWIRLLRSGALNQADTARAIETIDRNSRFQAQLIEDLLDVSRIVAGKMRLDARAISPAAVVAAALETIRPAAIAKRIDLNMVASATAGPVLADADRLQQVVWNLLSNAIKFTPSEGRVDVTVRRAGSQVEIIVADTGQGIDPDYLPIAFDRFTQADRSTTRVHGGLGVGLAVVKSIVELHGGSVAAHSEGIGRGARFTVSLPVSPVGSEARAHHRPEPQIADHTPCPKALAGLKILVVDDEPDTLQMVSTAFRQCGAQVESSTSATDALERFEVWLPDVLVADISMPGMDGYGLIRAIRARPASDGGGVAAVALTALGRVEDRMSALAAGYHVHLPKPVEIDELREVVAGLTGMVSALDRSR